MKNSPLVLFLLVILQSEVTAKTEKCLQTEYDKSQIVDIQLDPKRSVLVNCSHSIYLPLKIRPFKTEAKKVKASRLRLPKCR